MARARPGAVFVEVGCWLGRSTAFLAQAIRDSGKDIRFYAVDHGLGSPGGGDHGWFQADLDRCGGSVAGLLCHNLRQCGVQEHVVPIVTTSGRASQLFDAGSLAFVFLDADHRYEAVWEDLRCWWGKVRPGGILAGHDYTDCWPDVIRAVNDFFGKERVTVPDCSCWSVVKEEEARAHA